jgi:hypothetical protein
MFIPLHEFNPVHEAVHASRDRPVVRTTATNITIEMPAVNSFFMIFHIVFPLSGRISIYANYKNINKTAFFSSNPVLLMYSGSPQ